MAGLGVPFDILRTREWQSSLFLTRAFTFTLNNRLHHIAINMDITERLAKLEYKIGRIFQDRLTAIEAINSIGQPVHYRRTLHAVRRNDELAIIGDKAIDLVLGLMWYRSRDTRGLLCISVMATDR